MMSCKLVRQLFAPAICVAALSGCASLESVYKPVQTTALTRASDYAARTCDNSAEAAVPSYRLGYIHDCTSPQTLVIYAFSGGGIRSASFGYGALLATHGVDVGAGRRLDQDIDIVSGVSGGAFTAAAFANERGALFAASPSEDRYRQNFLTHDFMSDLLAIYLEPWHWQWLLPDYGTNDEMAKAYGSIDFASSSDKLFGETFGDLAKKGRPYLILQATDFGNEQPFTFTQNDFDLICSDVNTYPVAYAVAASNGFPVLFSPMQLANRHFAGGPAGTTQYCGGRNPDWVDRTLRTDNPPELSRSFSRAQVAEGYLPPTSGQQGDKPANPYGQKSARERPVATSSPQFVYLQDGGVADNVALRGLMNIVSQDLANDVSGSREFSPEARAAACATGLDRVEKILVVSVDGEAQPDNAVSSLPYLSDIGRVLNVASSAAIDASDFETLLAADSMTRQLAHNLSTLRCSPDTGQAPEHDVDAFFARVSFRNLSASTMLNGAACGKRDAEACTVGEIARSGTSLHFSPQEVDALISAGRSAFLCNPKIRDFLVKSRATWAETPVFACAAPLPAH